MAKRGPKPKPLPAALVERYRRGELNAREVARQAGIHPDTALDKLRAAGVDTRTGARTRLYHARDARNRRRREQAARLYGRGLGLAAVARRMGITAQGVRHLLIRAGVPRRAQAGPAAERRRAEAVRLYGQGLSLSAVADRLGMTAAGVRLILVRAGVPRRPAGGRKGGPAGG